MISVFPIDLCSAGRPSSASGEAEVARPMAVFVHVYMYVHVEYIVVLLGLYISVLLFVVSFVPAILRPLVTRVMRVLACVSCSVLVPVLQIDCSSVIRINISDY